MMQSGEICRGNRGVEAIQKYLTADAKLSFESSTLRSVKSPFPIVAIDLLCNQICSDSFESRFSSLICSFYV